MNSIVIVNKNLLGTSIKKGDICILLRRVGNKNDAFFIKSCVTGIESMFFEKDFDYLC